jgi:hypothetical protein
MSNAIAQDAIASPNRLKIQIELLSWLITAIITYLIVSPILATFSEFDYLYSNIIFVVIFLTYTRYIFLLPYTFLAHWQLGKFLFIFASIPLVFYLVNAVFLFEEFSNDEGLVLFEKYLNPNISYVEQQASLTYMRREMLFFGSSSIIVAVLLPFRFLISVWRVYNRTGKV